jgi:hypothetical protein
MPSLVWIEGGEHGLFVTGSGGTLWSTVTTAAGGSWTQETSAIARTGKCIKAVAPASLAHNIRSPTVAGDFPNALAVLRFYVRFETLPITSLVTCAFINPNGGSFHELVFDPTNGFFGHRIGSAAASYDNVTVATGTWYCIDMKYNVSANPWTADCQIDGRALTQKTNAVAAGTMLNCGFGTALTTQPAHTFYIDDVAASGTSADYPLGAGHVTLLVPGSDGTHSFTANDFSTGDAGTQRAPSYTDFYLMVDDAMPWATARSTTDDIAQRVIRTTGYVEIAPGTTPDTGTANGVQARLAYSSTTTTADTGACIVRNSAGTSVVLWGDLPAGQGGGGGALADYSESSNFFKRVIVTAPGAGWTPTEINAIRWRLGGSSDISPIPTWQALLLEVDVPDAAGGATTLTPDALAHSRSTPAPQVNVGIFPAALTHSRAVYAPNASPRIFPAALSHAHSVFAPDLDTILKPTALTHSRAIPVPKVSPSIPVGTLTHTRTVYSPSISGAITLLPALLTHTRSSPAPKINPQLRLGVLSHTRTVYSLTLLSVLKPAALTHARAIYTPNVVHVITPVMLTHSRSLPALIISVRFTVPMLSHTRGVYVPFIPGLPADVLEQQGHGFLE